MAVSIQYLEGKKMCVVFVQVLDQAEARVKLHCFHGRASVERGRLNVISGTGAVCPVPNSALGNIMPNDGTKMLRDAEYFVMVRTDERMKLVSSN